MEFDLEYLQRQLPALRAGLALTVQASGLAILISIAIGLVYRELDLGGAVRYILLDRFSYWRTVMAGMYWRASDAGYLFAGSEYDDWTVGISYDLNFSDLVPASRHLGGIELTAVRVFRKKPPVPCRYKACPTQL